MVERTTKIAKSWRENHGGSSEPCSSSWISSSRTLWLVGEALELTMQTDIIDVQYHRMLGQLDMMPPAPSPTASTFPTSQYVPSTRGVSTPSAMRQRKPIPSQLRPASPASRPQSVQRAESPGSTHREVMTTRSRGSVLIGGEQSTFVDFLSLR